MADVVGQGGDISRSRRRIRELVETRLFERTIITIIIINAVTLGLETSGRVMSSYGALLLQLDKIILAIFVVELALRMYAYGARFWRDAWSLFDFVIVAIALLPASGNLSVLRAFRIIRALRLISVFPSMRRVVDGLIRAIPGMGSITLLLLLIFYVFSVMATKLYGGVFPEWFGTIGASAYSLFQIMTLESWSEGIVRPVMKEFPYAWAFFVPFILVTSFAVLNLFIGIIVDAMQGEHVETREVVHDESAMTDQDVRDVLKEVRALRQEVRELHAELETGPRE